MYLALVIFVSYIQNYTFCDNCAYNFSSFLSNEPSHLPEQTALTNKLFKLLSDSVKNNFFYQSGNLCKSSKPNLQRKVLILKEYSSWIARPSNSVDVSGLRSGVGGVFFGRSCLNKLLIGQRFPLIPYACVWQSSFNPSNHLWPALYLLFDCFRSFVSTLKPYLRYIYGS